MRKNSKDKKDGLKVKFLPSPKSMSDKERILLYVIAGLRTQMLWILPGMLVEKNKPHSDIMQKEQIQPGELVISQGSGLHPFTISFFVRKSDDFFSSYIVREIGSKKECHITNDSFDIIRGIDPNELLEGAQYKAYRDMRLAISKVHDWYRYGGSYFDTDGNLIVQIREKFGGLIRNDRFESEMFQVILPQKNSSVKKYKELLESQGVGTRKFRVLDKLTGLSISKEEYRDIETSLVK